MTNNQPEEQTQAVRNLEFLKPSSLLGYVLGGVSLLNLVKEFKLIKLYGLVKDWTDAFSSFILSVRDFLFGWIKISWLQITNFESYLLVILFLLVSSYLRALQTGHLTNSETYGKDLKHNRIDVIVGIFATVLLFYFAIFMLFALLALIIPELITIIFFTLIIISTSIWLIFPGKKDNLKAVLLARSNLLGSIIIFLILVAVNYGLMI